MMLVPLLDTQHKQYLKRPHLTAVCVNPDAIKVTFSCAIVAFGYALLYGRPTTLWFGSQGGQQ